MRPPPARLPISATPGPPNARGHLDQPVLRAASRSASPRATQVMGDSSPDADKLMRSQGVRALPSFHFWKGGKKIDVVNGANTEALTQSLKKHA